MKFVTVQFINSCISLFTFVICWRAVFTSEANDIGAHDGTCESSDHECTDEIIVQLSRRDTWLADRIAEKHGYKNLGQVGSLPHYFWFKRKDETRKKRHVFSPLIEDSDIRWAEPQFSKKRVKRDYVHGVHKKRQVNSSELSVPTLPWPDPLYSKQWYLIAGAVGGYDMKVKEAWNLGYSGKGVVVSILDDGLQKAHPDLAENYDSEASFDINSNDDDPTPRDDDNNKHGTRCAGEVSAVAGNNICGVGIAYKSKIGGVRMLDGTISDRVEGAALSLKQNHIDIYSASWGPDDDGRTVDGPGVLAKDAFYYGATKGRHGKGNIFIWASGNGGTHQDSCSCDGYAISIFTLSVSSATYDNRQPWYSEECPSTLATTYSSGFNGQPAIVTTDMPNTCTEFHTGTSASAPIAAGIVALALEANPNLTWRDLQHLVIRTSNAKPLLENPGWSKNGAGRMISNKFGYGLMDAESLVKAALVWKTVPPQLSYTYNGKHNEPKELNGKFSVNFTINVDSIHGKELRYLEHVQSVISVKVKRRGDIQLTLYSPAGTRSILLPQRSSDDSSLGFTKWPFMSVQQWGENPYGTWILNVENVGNGDNSGLFQEWSLTLFGTGLPSQPNDDDAARTTVLHENCHSECSLDGCYVPQSAKHCVSCKNYEQFLSNSTETICVTHCEKSFYVEPVGKRCHPCLDECLTCKETKYCSSCPRGTYLFQEDHDGNFHGRCIEHCPEGYVKAESETGDRCLHICDSKNCLTCDEKTQCRYCKENFFMTSTGECIQNCFDGWYGNVTSRQCHRCIENCETCLNAHSCNVCSTGFFWNSTVSRCTTPTLASCNKDNDCQHGSYCEVSGQKCQLCHPDCETCFGPEFDQCKKCRNGMPADRLTRQCSICNRGEYYDSKSGGCNPCATSCASCIGAGATQCVDCNVGYKQIGLTCKPCCQQSDGVQPLSCVVCHSDGISSTSSLVTKLVIGFVVGGILCIVALAVTIILSKKTFQKLGMSKFSVRYLSGKSYT